jgi:DNA-binding response OmpR family regulator
VIDDNPEVCDVLRMCLHIQGFEVMTALNAAEAMDSIASVAPDVILLDHNLPRMSCGQLVSLIRALLPQVPIVLISGIYDLKDRAAQLGIPHFLAKPFDLDNLASLLNTLVSDPHSHHEKSIMKECLPAGA